MKQTTSQLIKGCRILLAVLLLQYSALKAQMVGSNAYIKATSLEIGLSGAGGFEGCDVTTSPPLAGMHYRSGTNFFGFVANPQVNSWATFDGDFFTPGSPENGWGFEVGTTGAAKGGNNCSNLNDIPGAITHWSHTFSCYSADWEGNATSGTDLHFKINYFLQENDLYYTTTVSITNNTSATIADMYYYRNVDPDNNETLTSDYSTQNTIVSQPGSGCNLAHVSATQALPWNSYIGLAAIGANWRVNYGGFNERDGSNIWNGIGAMGTTPFVQTVGSTNFYDEAISLAYRIQNLAPGATETFKFVVILDSAAATNAINNLLYFTYPGAAGAPSSVCTAVADTVGTCGGPVPIDVSGSNVSDYNWSWTPATGLSTTTGTSVSANPTATTTYTATGTPLVPCLAPITMSVVVKVTPGAGANPVIASVPPLCISSSPITLSADSSGGVWSGTGITNPATGAFNPATAGIGTTIITYSTSSTCNTSDTVMITIDSTYNATIAQPPSICISGAPVTLNDATPGGTWSGTGITSTTAGTFDPATAGLGSHLVTYAITGTCASSDTVNVEVTSLFDATITQPAPVCSGTAPLHLHAAHPGGVWSGVNITDSIAGTYTPLTVGTHTVQYTIAGGCGSTDTVNITVLATPDVTLAPVPPLCLSSSPITLSADSAGGIWSGAGITNSATGTFDPGNAGLGVHIITYATSGTCGTLDTLYIAVNTFSDATIQPMPAICVSASPLNLSAVTPGGTWSGTGITNASMGTFDPVTAGLGAHQVSYTIAGSCAAMDTAIFVVTNLFNPTITQPPHICAGSDSIHLTAAHPGGIWSGIGITDSIHGTYTPDTAGVHLVTYTISGACGNTDTVNVTVLPSADASIMAASAVCAGSPAFNLSGATSGGTWSGTGITNSTAGTFNPATAGTFPVTYSIGGTCGDTATRNIIVHALPTPTFTPDATSGCVPVCINFNEGTSPLCNIVHYSFGDGDTSNVSSPLHCYDSAGVFSVTIRCIDVNGCVGTHTDSALINVSPIPVTAFTITPASPVAINTPVVFTNHSTPGSSSYWIFGDSTHFNNSTIDWSPTHSYTHAGTYCVTLISTNAGGCRDTATDCIEVIDPNLAAPNIFTPNGDGSNDTWFVTGEGVRDFSCSIYDRWGVKMKEWSGIQNGWNGDSNTGGLAPDGTYYYVITYTLINSNDAMSKQGYIQLLRN